MIRKSLRIVVALLCFTAPLRAQKQLCITVDDLPTFSRVYYTAAGKDSLTRRLLTHLTRYNVPAIGFVIGEKLLTKSTLNTREVTLLTQWLNAGMELGNHTFAHRDYNTTSAASYQQDVLGADTLLRSLLQGVNQPLRYFRHPYLHRGNTISKRDSLVRYLADHQYREAPVSIDNSDYIFSAAYDAAMLRNDATLAASIGNQYVDYMLACVHYYEAQADSLFKRAIAHILLTHANTINSFYLGNILSRLKAEGYRFVSIHEALQDPAYQSRDDYAGNGGISWIHRWALTQGKRGLFFKGEPEVPTSISSLADNK